jgi:formate dehydrogenase major subunit
VTWQSEDFLDIHESDAELRGVADGTWVELASRVGKTKLRARISERVPPGVVYTTFHFPISGANVVTTEYSDWATNCPEYKVTAVEVRPTLEAGGVASAHELGLEELHTEVHEDATAALVRMVNEITSNCSHLHQLAAIEAVSTHLRMFWAPQMIEDLTTYAKAHPESLQDVALVAIGQVPTAVVI